MNVYEDRVMILDGGTHSALLDLDWPSYGLSDVGPDWNGDDSPDLLRKNWPYVEVVSIAAPWADPLGQPCSAVRGEKPRIIASGTNRVGQGVNLRLTGVTPGRDAYLAIGIPGPSRFPGQRSTSGRCGLWFTPARLLPARTATFGCNAAGVDLSVQIPSDPLLSGSHFFAQWLIASAPGTWSTTRGLRIQIE